MTLQLHLKYLSRQNQQLFHLTQFLPPRIIKSSAIRKDRLFFSNLPNEIKILIFSYFDLETILRLSRTCKEWNELIWKSQHSLSIPFKKLNYAIIKKAAIWIERLSLHHLHNLRIRFERGSCNFIKNESLMLELFIPMKELNTLKFLSIDLFPRDPQAMDTISLLTSLRSLELSSPSACITTETFKKLFKLTQLESLSLIKTNQLCNEDVSCEISKLTRLVSLDLQWSDISSFSLRTIMPSLTRLKSLNISNCKYGILEDAAIEFYPIGLESLYLRNNTFLSTHALIYLRNLQHLRILDLYGVENVTNEVLSGISHLKHLEVLYMPIKGSWNTNGIHFLIRLRSLRKLFISSSMPFLNNKAMEYIGKIESLEEISITSDYITDEGLKHLNQLKKLKVMSFKGCQNIQKGLKYIRNESIIKLNISYSGVIGYKRNAFSKNHPIENALETITHFESLNVLVMKGCSNIKKEEYSNLKKLKQLRILKVDRIFEKNFERSEENKQFSIVV